MKETFELCNIEKHVNEVINMGTRISACCLLVLGMEIPIFHSFSIQELELLHE